MSRPHQRSALAEVFRNTIHFAGERRGVSPLALLCNAVTKIEDFSLSERSEDNKTMMNLESNLYNIIILRILST